MVLASVSVLTGGRSDASFAARMQKSKMVYALQEKEQKRKCMYRG